MEENVKVKASNKKCKNCGGDLIFNPKTQKLDCEKCGSQFDITMIKYLNKNPYVRGIPNQDTHAWAREPKKMKCQTCGADIELYGLIITSKCQYCESNYVTDINELPGLKPEAVIPFKFVIAFLTFSGSFKSSFFNPAFERTLSCIQSNSSSIAISNILS